MSAFGRVMLIPYFTAYLIYYFYNSKTRGDSQKLSKNQSWLSAIYALIDPFRVQELVSSLKLLLNQAQLYHHEIQALCRNHRHLLN